MPTDCNSKRNKYSLEQGGTAQSSREPLAFRPDYVKVDERTFAGWITFVRDYAKFIQYYNKNNTPDGDWGAFWSNNPAIVLANLAAAPIADFRKSTREIFNELQKLDNQSNENLLKQHLNLLFDNITTLAWQLDRHINLLPNDLPLKSSLRSRINSTLAPALAKWIAWQKAATDGGLLEVSQAEINPELAKFHILGAAVMPTEDFYINPSPELVFSDDWLTGGDTDWSIYVDSDITADASIFGDPLYLTTIPEQISFAIRHFFFTSVYEQFLKGFALAVAEAEKALHSLLYSWNRHEPHFALFLAFLRMLSKEQAYLNRLTDEHLRFYYERVLRLRLLAAKPARAYILIELAKHKNTHPIKAGTKIKAGKDKLGKEIIFGVDEDFVANKAMVTELRSVFKVPDNVSEYHFGDPDRPKFKDSDRNRYFAAPVSNSSDGLGEVKLSTQDGRWHPFGNRSIDANDNTWRIDMPEATIGFAIASHYLFMTQGNRTVELKFNGSDLESLGRTKFLLSLTTEEGWYETTAEVSSEDNIYKLSWVVPGDAPSILPYDADVHLGNFDTKFPVLKTRLVHDGNSSNYQSIKHLTLNSLDLTVKVIGKRNMALSSSTGPLDASKPFYPFGAAPDHGAVFTIGDKEVYQKKSEIIVDLLWKENYQNIDYFSGIRIPSLHYRELRNGQWTSWFSNRDEIDILPKNHRDITATFTLRNNAIIDPDFDPNTPLSSESVGGYRQFRLWGDWGHRRYPLALAKYAKDSEEALPSSLYDPQVLEISLDYTASQTINLSDAEVYASEGAQFFHLHPFGEAERVPAGDAQLLLPHLVPQTINNVGKDGGEWYIGIEGLVPPQQLSLLI
jgi:hypothetical protein